MAIIPEVEFRGMFFMTRFITCVFAASLALASATPVFAQGRFGVEAAQRRAEREEREAIRRAEYPELYEKPGARQDEAPTQEVASSSQQSAEPAPAPASPAPAQ